MMTARTARLDPFCHRLAVFDNKYIDPRLVGDERRLRNYDFLLRFPRLDNNGQQLAIDNASFRVGNGGTRQDRVRRAI